MKNILLLSIFITQISLGAETDGFTSRYQDIKDGLPAINLELNNKVTKVLDKLNSDNKINICDYEKLNSYLGNELRQPFRGKIEDFILTTIGVHKSKVSFDQSIFKSVSTYHRSVLQLGVLLGVGYSPPIKHKGLLIGADKFGHFIDEGYYYYKLIYDWDYSLEEVLKFGEYIEFYIEGKTTGGVYSYADLAANYDGHIFWLDLLGVIKKNIPSKYFSCNQGKWTLKLKINLDHYINPSWDEGMNCNDYISSDMKKDIDIVIAALEKKDKKRYHCPVYPEKVKAMIKRYGKHSKSVISPTLLTH